jgi:hypothetical protein
MTEENCAGSANVDALERSTNRGAAASTAPAREVGPYSAQVGYTGVEKRSSARIKCEGTVEMREQGCDATTVAKIADISLHGCYVETHATYPVGVPLDLTLYANGIRVRTKAMVRVNNPYLGMGIAFAEVSPETRDRIRDMVQGAPHPIGSESPQEAPVLPALLALRAEPEITDASGALHALIEFFRDNQVLTREGFIRILWKTAP